MKSLITRVLVSLITVSGFFAAQAEPTTLLGKYDYTQGDLVGQNGWQTAITSNAALPIQVLSTELSHPTEYGTGEKAISIPYATSSNQRPFYAFAPQTTGEVYYSMLLRVDNHVAQTNPLIAFWNQGEAVTSSSNMSATSNLLAGLSIRTYNRAATKGDTVFQMCVSTTGQTMYNAKYSGYADTFNIHQTYLVVVKYKFFEGEQNDSVYLWIDPTSQQLLSSTPPAPRTQWHYISGSDVASTDISPIASIVINRGCANSTISALRVATTWAGLFDREGGGGDTPYLTFSPFATSETFLQGETYEQKVVVRGQNLTGDITVSNPTNSDVSIDKNTLEQAKVESESGDTLTVTIAGNTLSTPLNDSLMFSGGGLVDDVKYLINWFVIPVTDLSSLSAAHNLVNPSGYYRISNVIISHADHYSDDMPIYYAQDATAGIKIDMFFSDVPYTTYQVGDKIGSMTGLFEEIGGMTALTFSLTHDPGAPIATAQSLTPINLKLTDLQSGAANYESMLVKIDTVEFYDRSAGSFAAATNVKIRQDASQTNFNARAFVGTDLVGALIPEYANITGISTAKNGTVISIRQLSDLQEITSVAPPQNPNLLTNWGFENWTNSIPDSWEVTAGTSAQETVSKIEGNYSLAITGAPTAVAQKIVGTFTAGDRYEFTVNYRIMEGADEPSEGAVRLASYWVGAGESHLTMDDKILDDPTIYLTPGQGWKSKKVVTVAPEQAEAFYFKVIVSKGAVVYLDDFSFVKNNSADIYPEIEVPSRATQQFEVTVGDKDTNTLTIDGINLAQPIFANISGADAACFSTNISTIAISSLPYSLKIIYNPTVAGTHNATLNLASGTADTVKIQLHGAALAVGAKPQILVNSSGLTGFSAALGSEMEQTVTFSYTNVKDYVYVKREGTGMNNFVISNTLFPSTDQTGLSLKITYRPLSIGSHTANIVFYTLDADTVKVPVTGVCSIDTGSTATFDSNFYLDITSPLALLNENFDSAVNNQPLVISDWRNVVTKGARPWWGFDENATNKCAKATAYIYQVQDSIPYEMWLVTPALDGVNAASKWFTFRVKGEFMFENHTTTIELYYMEKDGDGAYKYLVELAMPETPEENGEWVNFTLDLTPLNVADVFFMGFRFRGNSGAANSVVYYIDDVTYGRTDIPIISSDSSSITFKAIINEMATSVSVPVTGSYLTSRINLQVEGTFASLFALSTDTLGADGGSFTVSFIGAPATGIYTADVRLSNVYAASLVIPVSVEVVERTATELSNSVDDIRVWQRAGELHVTAGGLQTLWIYNVVGNEMTRVAVNGDNATIPVGSYASGLYFAKIRTAKGLQVVKFVK
ncbi:MAG: choice-of-anchor J domain-containing protein [Bacteroidales bacterium]|jgi:hypothetical protein|nr:choice-of-anchor J domain-containing protein [Bacteroidales bacterium]